MLRPCREVETYDASVDSLYDAKAAEPTGNLGYGTRREVSRTRVVILR